MISVIVPIYNSEKYLQQCIDSIINQSYQNLEILLIDDGSEDRSLQICEEYAKKDRRIRIISKKNTGVSDTRNVGILEANGEYISFVDSDDYINVNMLEVMYNTLLENSVDVVRCIAYIYDKNNNRHQEDLYNLKNKTVRKEKIEDVIFRFVTRTNNINCYTPLLLIKKAKIINFNTNLYFMEDTDFYVRLMLNIDAIYFLDTALYNYRYNKQSSSKNADKCIKNIYGIIDSTNNIKKTLLENNILSNDLLYKINYQIFNLIMSKINLLHNNQFSIVRKNLVKVFNDKLIRKVILNVKFRNLSLNKKIQYLLIRYKLFFIMGIQIKIRNVSKK